MQDEVLRYLSARRDPSADTIRRAPSSLPLGLLSDCLSVRTGKMRSNLPPMSRRLVAVSLSVLTTSVVSAEVPLSTPTSLSATDLAKLKESANYSDANAQYRLGMLYLNGTDGVEKDVSQSRLFLKNAALQGHAEAAYELGSLISQTRGDDGDQALRWLLFAAEKNIPRAQFELGGLYVYFGQGTNAIPWYEKAIAQGHIGAKGKLGAILMMGIGTKKDEKRAVMLLSDAANGGDAEAARNLGAAYLNGSGVPKNEAIAITWVKKAADSNDASAQVFLGKFYCAGTASIAPDRAKGEKWLHKAADQGNAEAKAFLKTVEKSSRYIWERPDILESHAESGESEAQYTLARRYMEGTGGVPKDDKKTVLWLTKSAEQGNATAQYDLSALYFNGTGVKKDKKTSLALLTKSAENGYSLAQYWLGVQLRENPEDFDSSQKWLKKAAAQGDKEAQDMLDAMQRSVRELTEKAAGGDAVAQYELGRSYLFGKNMVKDEKLGEDWVTKSANNGNPDAQVLIGGRLMVKSDEKSRSNGVAFLTKAAEQNDYSAMVCLGLAYAGAIGTPQNDALAAKWLLKSGPHTKAAIQEALGKIYSSNEGVPPDDIEAYARYSLAVELAPPNWSERKACTDYCDFLTKKLGTRLPEAQARLKKLRDELPPAPAKP